MTLSLAWYTCISSAFSASFMQLLTKINGALCGMIGFLRLTALTVAVIVFTADIFAVTNPLAPLFTSDELATSIRFGRLCNLFAHWDP